MLSNEEYRATHLYVLLNCPEIDPFIEIFYSHLRETIPNISDQKIERMR
ncbi:hypothetical protein MANES_04G063973v8 [Manihot esculenta]|uniref:Uncharacterized protein n=1 Tax=Manihot esculenta TaxID=3983 RepID=A0ACB7HY38_MANES|nr:hypothetical protein MANES_04G063973v8 [Manihot esculenta]